jgi:Nucleotidyltransferase/DNA polymerase involved in DNA repair
MAETRSILHSDMNSFYASVEMMLDPSLKGKAVAVCGSTEERHGIVLAKSELAKKAGVKTGMVAWEARQRCPGLILVPPQYDQYLKYSKLAHEVYYRYTDLVEPFGMDECWLDVTHSRIYGTGLDIAQEIRAAMREELGLTVSVGVSYNKIFAKLGSDMRKPDAVTTIGVDNYKEKVWPLPASDLLYVGSATNRKLEKYGIHTIGQIAAVSPDCMRSWFGVNGLKLWHYANGTDISRVMHKDFVSPVKSVGHGITCTADLESDEEVFKVLLELSQDVGHRLRIHDLAARGVQIYCAAMTSSDHSFNASCHLRRSCQRKSQLQVSGFSKNDTDGTKKCVPYASVPLTSFRNRIQSSSPYLAMQSSGIVVRNWRMPSRIYDSATENGR